MPDTQYSNSYQYALGYYDGVQNMRIDFKLNNSVVYLSAYYDGQADIDGLVPWSDIARAMIADAYDIFNHYRCLESGEHYES